MRSRERIGPGRRPATIPILVTRATLVLSAAGRDHSRKTVPLMSLGMTGVSDSWMFHSCPNASG